LEKKISNSLPLGYPWKLSTKTSYQKSTVQSVDDTATIQQHDTPKVATTAQPATFNSATANTIKLESIKLTDQVPPRFKKYIGKTWMELLKDTEYIKFCKERGAKDIQPLLEAAISQYQTMMKEFDDVPDNKIVT